MMGSPGGMSRREMLVSTGRPGVTVALGAGASAIAVGAERLPQTCSTPNGTHTDSTEIPTRVLSLRLFMVPPGCGGAVHRAGHRTWAHAWLHHAMNRSVSVR